MSSLKGFFERVTADPPKNPAPKSQTGKPPPAGNLLLQGRRRPRDTGVQHQSRLSTTQAEGLELAAAAASGPLPDPAPQALQALVQGTLAQAWGLPSSAPKAGRPSARHGSSKRSRTPSAAASPETASKHNSGGRREDPQSPAQPAEEAGHFPIRCQEASGFPGHGTPAVESRKEVYHGLTTPNALGPSSRADPPCRWPRLVDSPKVHNEEAATPSSPDEDVSLAQPSPGTPKNMLGASAEGTRPGAWCSAGLTPVQRWEAGRPRQNNRRVYPLLGVLLTCA